VGVGFSVGFGVERRSHVNKSFYQFGFFNVRHGSITLFKFIAGELVTVFQRRHF
jgi:hypothetical protein